VWFIYGDNPFLTKTADLGHVPDSVEYLLLGERIARAGSLTLDVNGIQWPTRYPPLMSIILSPLFYIFQTVEQVAAIAPVLIGSATIATAFIVFHRLFNSTVALIFSFLLATSPLLQVSSFTVVTEPIFILLLLLNFLYITHELKKPKIKNRILIGVISGSLIILKLQSIFIISIVFLTIFLIYKYRQFIKIIQIIIPFTLICLSFPLYNLYVFGHPLTTGYTWQVGQHFFSNDYFYLNILNLYHLFFGYKVNLFGFPVYAIPIGLPIIGIFGAISAYKKFGFKPLLSILTIGTISTIPLLFYAFIDLRFLILIVLILMGFISIFLGNVIFPYFAQYFGSRVSIIIILFVIFLWPFFGNSSLFFFNKSLNTRNWPSENYILAKTVKNEVIKNNQANAYFLSGLYLPTIAHWLNPNITVYPIFSTQCFADCDKWVKDKFSFNILELKKLGTVYFSDAGVDKNQFDLFCADLSKNYSIIPISNISRWRLYMLKDKEFSNNQDFCR
jgi:hypothetical protein